MAHEVQWTKSIYEEFCAEAMLSELEAAILRTRIQNWSRVKQATEYNLSVSAVDRIIKSLKQKYDCAALNNPKLPARHKKSVKEEKN